MLHQRIEAGAAHALETGHADEDRRRDSKRYVTVLKVGKAVVDGTDQLCLVRNMSREGAKLDIYHGVTQNQKITVELRSDKVVTGTVRWVGDRAAGIEFDEPVDVSDLLQHKSHRGVLRKLPRAPRFIAQANMELEHDHGRFDGKLINISLHGLCVETVAAARIDDRIVARIEGLPARSSTVRWLGENLMGLHFDMPMGFSELARWLQDH